jgi:CTP:molybdopterin cytidylyltransferase MocA
MQAVVTTPPTASTRDIQALFTATTTIVPVNDPGVLMNIDSPADYEQLKQRGP